jgi:hypothetical protein
VQRGAPHMWKTYTNVRFQYAICYPRDLLVPQGESENSDGQKFLADDGGQLIVFGSNNALNQLLADTLRDTVSRLSEHGKATYVVLKAKWFVVSGQNDRSVFYAKTITSRGQFKSFELTYPRSATAVYEPLIRRLAACFADLA